MTFHRLTVPTYPGGLLAGYDLINDPTHPSVGGSGVAAPADGPKNGGPNDGSYFVAYHEDGRALHYNRPAKALAENTDFLDDILRTGIPVPTFANATAAGAVSTHNIVGVVYVGKSGATNNQDQRDRLVRITDQNNNDLEVSGSKIVATLIHDGASVNVVGTQVTGFRTNASVNVSPPIPNGTAYRIWFGTRNSFANISLVDKGPLFEEQMRLIQNVSGEVRSLFRQIHSETAVNQAWDAPFDSTIRSLAASGLNERYRRATLQPAGFVSGDFNVAGSGGSIFRDGPAVTIINDEISSVGASYIDPNHASFKIVSERPRDNNSNAISDNSGGAVGYWHEVEWRSKDTTDSAQVTRGASQGPALVEVIPRDIRADAYGADTHLTRISPVDATATLNPDSGVSSTARKTLQCAAGQYFSLTGPTRTAIRCGIDMLEITRPDTAVQTYIIESIVSSTRVTLKSFAGGDVAFPTTALAGCSIRWIQVVTSIGGRLQQDSGGSGLFSRPLLCVPPGIGTVTPANELVGPCAFFGSQTGSVVDATANARRARALEWGSTGNPDSGGTVNGSVVPNGWLNGDGSIRATRISVTGDASVAGNLSVSGDLSVLDDLTVTSDAAIGGGLSVGQDTDIGGDLSVTDLTETRAFKEDEHERYVIFREDWTRFKGFFSPNYIITDDGYWEFNEITDVFTLNNGTSTAKNPGQLELIGAGGLTTREISIRKGSLPIAFANVELMTLVVKINGGAANVADSITIGLMDNPEQQVGGADAIALFFFRSSSEWRLFHRVGGANGPQHNTVLSAFTNNSFISVKMLKNASGNLEIYVNGSGTPTTTILAANIPAGFCTLGMYLVQTVADADPATYVVDYMETRAITSGNRSGA